MSGVEKKENIIVCNATENNLKNVSVDIPLNEFTCVTGPSGCGKSSLVYDTIYAESQRNFLESMSGNMYGQKLMDKPKVEEIKNLRPALNVSQNYYNVNPRSTIGTVSDISYFLRALFALYSKEVLGKIVDSNYFSANNPSSCCRKCKGLGEEYIVSEKLLIPDVTKTLDKGGISFYKGGKSSLEYKLLEAICEKYNIDINKKVSELSKKEMDILLYKKDKSEYFIRFKTPKGRYKQKSILSSGAIVELNKLLEDVDTPSTFASISKYLEKSECSMCDGTKLKKDVLNIRICDKNIAEVEKMPLEDLLLWTKEIVEYFSSSNIYSQIIQLTTDIEKRVSKLMEVNLEYLSLGRSIPSLSGGEIQRVRIANQLSCSLSGIVYILDEPCKGLHFRNINSIINATNTLVEKGNTVIAIEHNKQYISRANKIIELGPQGGPQGGYIINSTVNNKEYIYDIKYKESKKCKEYISFKGVNYHNLKNIDVKIPLARITCISGVSGAGKSSLTTVIDESCEKHDAVKCKKVDNVSKIKRVLHVNQQPIGKTPRSTVISYLGIYDAIRDIFAETDISKKNKLSSSSFSMNVVGGRCECCQGTGKKKIELTYMPDSYIECPECHGKRFIDSVLEVKYKNYNINDILDKPIEEIVKVFEENLSVHNILMCMIQIGMGYISLGQMSMSLSGGEAQRIKLAKCLGAKSTGKNLYILDEPTSGLNEKDVLLLENVLEKLSNDNETIIIIEHNAEFISHVADYVIDLGTTAGEKGGTFILEGNTREIFENENSSWKDFNS